MAFHVDGKTYIGDLTKVNLWYQNWNAYCTLIPKQSKFLKDLGYDLNVTRHTQLDEIYWRGQFHIKDCKRFHKLLQSRVDHLSRPGDLLDRDKKGIRAFCTTVQNLLVKTSHKIATLEDMTDRAHEQQGLLIENLTQQYHPPSACEVPVEMESLFRHGQPVVIMFIKDQTKKEVDIDELSATADDGEESPLSEYQHASDANNDDDDDDDAKVRRAQLLKEWKEKMGLGYEKEGDDKNEDDKNQEVVKRKL
ncbi:MAG: hypothetical protein Q9188_005022 [Gyalolechia gomerana]